MKFRHIVIWAAAAALPQLTLAADSPIELGALHAVFDFCAKIDPAQSNSFNGQAESLFNGLGRPQVTALLENSAYKQGYENLTKSLRELPHGEAVPACRAISGPSPGGDPDRGHK